MKNAHKTVKSWRWRETAWRKTPWSEVPVTEILIFSSFQKVNKRSIYCNMLKKYIKGCTALNETKINYFFFQVKKTFSGKNISKFLINN